MSPRRTRALETIERNARAQKRLIEDLLDVSRIVTGKVALELVSVDPRRVVEAALDTMLPAAQTKGLRLVPQLETGHGTRARRLRSTAASRLQPAVQRHQVHCLRRAGRSRLARRGKVRADQHCRTAVRASRRSFCRRCSIASARRTARSAGATAAWAWGWRSCVTWSSCTPGTVEAHSEGEGAGARIRDPSATARDARTAAPSLSTPPAAPGRRHRDAGGSADSRGR